VQKLGRMIVWKIAAILLISWFALIFIENFIVKNYSMKIVAITVIIVCISAICSVIYLLIFGIKRK
jgi:hypothetical protein